MQPAPARDDNEMERRLKNYLKVAHPGVPIFKLRCMDCSKWVHPAEVIRIGDDTIRCFACYIKINEIIESWAEPPRECAYCHTSFNELAQRTPGKPVSMFPHVMDGTIGFLCDPCSQAYVLKRADLYGKTRFGWENKLK